MRNNHPTRPDTPLVMAWGAIALIAILYAAWEWWAPVVWDDVYFAAFYRKFNNGSNRFSLTALAEFALDRRASDNGRLANILDVPGILYLGRAGRSILIGLCSAVTYTLMARLSRPTRGTTLRNDTLTIATLWLTGIFLLPWRDHIVLFDYAMNYVATSALLLIFLHIAIKSLNNNFSTSRLTIAIVLAIAAGWMHDGFSVPTCIALGIFTITRSFRLPLQSWAIGTAFLAGTLIAVSAPGEWLRVGREMTPHATVPLMSALKAHLRLFPSTALLCLLLAISALRKQWRRQLLQIARSPIFIISASYVIASIAIVTPFSTQQRYGWGTGLFSLIAIATILRHLLPTASKRIRTTIILTITLLATAEMAIIIHWQKIIYRQTADIIQQVEESACGTAYIDPLTANDIPMLSQARLGLGIWNTWFQMGALNIEAPSGRLNSVVPAVLSDYNATNARRIPGDAKLLEYRGIYLMEPRQGLFENGKRFGRFGATDIILDVTLSSGQRTTFTPGAWNFIAPDHTELVFLTPVDYPTEPIVAADFISSGMQ